MPAIDYDIDDVKVFFEDGIDYLIKGLDRDKIDFDALKKFTEILCPSVIYSERLTEMACKAILKKSIEARMIDGYFVAIVTKAGLDTRDAIIIAMSSCPSLIDIFGEEELGKVALMTAAKFF